MPVCEQTVSWFSRFLPDDRREINQGVSSAKLATKIAGSMAKNEGTRQKLSIRSNGIHGNNPA